MRIDSAVKASRWLKCICSLSEVYVPAEQDTLTLITVNVPSNF